jgi:hypothetical protein
MIDAKCTCCDARRKCVKVPITGSRPAPYVCSSCARDIVAAFAIESRRELECDLPPAGWRCTRMPGHSGPCAAVPAEHGRT